MPEISPEHPTDSQTGSQTDKSALSRLPLLIAAIAVVAGVLWWSRRPSPVEDTSTPVPNPTVRPTAAPKPTPPVKAPATITYTLYLPNDQALLSRASVSEKSPPGNAMTWEQKSKRALELLFKKVKETPAGTRVLDSPMREDKNIVRLNLSREFMKLDKSNHTAVQLVLDAMASTLGAVESPTGKPVKMKVLVEGKPLNEFSEFDLSEPWTSSQPQDETPPDAESVT